MSILIVGGGIGGLTLALSLHQAGIGCRVFEAAPEIKPLGVGINLLPHATRELTELGLQEHLAKVAVTTREVVFCNRFGQFIFREPRGRFAGYDWPQFSIHRGDLHQVLLDAVHERLGANAVALGKRCVAVEQDGQGVTVRFEDGTSVRGAAAVGCDGMHSAVRRILYPDEGPPAYQGINMWRGVTRARPYLGGASMVIGGWLEVGKIVVYPIRDAIDGPGTQLVNWVAEIQSPRNVMQDWNLAGKLEDFYPVFAGWRFDWLDVAALLRNAGTILEYPMVDRDPLPAWSRGCVTLLGDAAHPMVPRGSNGAGQAILDALALAACLRRETDPVAALRAYEAMRLKPAYDVVLMNRVNPPDAILREVYRRTGDRPFERIEDVISNDELLALSENYKRVAGFEREALARRESFI
ncbi:MAG: flavin-dependent oxidoreductase [Betaproteobacteria bacterium]|nr:flavin-dependent oxidoreductase [Betaproteobacteria bacterium]